MGLTIGFVIWALCAVLFVLLGVHAFFAQKPVGFWANADTPPIGDVRAYNRAVGRLWCAYGAVFLLLGTPMLSERAALMMCFACLGVVVETIVLIAVYTKIEQTYRKK